MPSTSDLLRSSQLLDTRELAQKIQQEQKKQELIERLTLGSAIGFLVVIMLAAWLTDGAIFSSAINALQTLEPASRSESNVILNCQKASNINTPYCQERLAETARDWRMISRQWGSKQTFNLTGK